jgi:peptide-methionine (S)-S-oxide reductase
MLSILLNMKRHNRKMQIALVLLLATVGLAGATAQTTGTATATFGGGCFWCMEKPFDDLDGVISTTSGYAGGHVENPTYLQVVQGGTGHLEVVRVEYDPSRVTYEDLLYVYWRNIDPTDGYGQFCDRGYSYQPAIFTESDEQLRLAQASSQRVRELLRLGIAVEIRPLNAFYPAEDYHQDYYINNPVRYEAYRAACRRDARLESVWQEEAGGEAPEPWLPEL